MYAKVDFACIAILTKNKSVHEIDWLSFWQKVDVLLMGERGARGKVLCYALSHCIALTCITLGCVAL